MRVCISKCIFVCFYQHKNERRKRVISGHKTVLTLIMLTNMARCVCRSSVRVKTKRAIYLLAVLKTVTTYIVVTDRARCVLSLVLENKA